MEYQTYKATDQEKAKALLNHFSSVFTQEPPGEIVRLENVNIQYNIENLKMNEDMVQKKLQNLNKAKSVGPDGIRS